MDKETLKEQILQWTAELEDVRRVIREAEERRAALWKMIQGGETMLRLLGGEPAGVTGEGEATTSQQVASSPANGSSPRGREAVRLIMSSDRRPWRQAALVEEVKRRGWVDPDAKNPEASVRVAVRRMADKGEVEKIATGVYRYVGPESGALAPETSPDPGHPSLLGEEE